MFQGELEALFDERCRAIIRENPHLAGIIGFDRFVLTHPNRHVVLKNLCEQVIGYEVAFRTNLDKRKRDDIINFVASLFIEAIKVKREQDDWSLVHKLSVQSEKSKYDEARSLIKEIDTDGQEKEIEVL